MKLAHMVVVTPRGCGLYETTRDLVMALRAQGIDSRLVDPLYADNIHHPRTPEDRGVPLERSMEFARGADFLINHSGLGEARDFDVPIIQVAHGRPVSSFKLEETGKQPIYRYYYEQDKIDRVKALVTFWEEHVPYWSVLFANTPVRCVPSMVNSDEWSMEGNASYNFKGNRGKINVVLTDPCRLDLDPYEALNAYALWARTQDGAKLHIYGQQYNGEKAWTTLLRAINDDGNLGEMAGWVRSGLDNLYRAASFVLTCNPIHTRTMREAMACGCPVAVVRDIKRDQHKLTAALFRDRVKIRKAAEVMFNPERSAKAFIDVLDEAA